jgi:hypothetical protein
VCLVHWTLRYAEITASLRISSSIPVALKPVRKTSSSIASLVSSRQFRPIFSIYVNELNSQSDKGALNVRWLKCCDGRAARWGGFFVDTVTRENNCYILMVTGSVSVKLRADSAGRTISLSPV